MQHPDTRWLRRLVPLLACALVAGCGGAASAPSHPAASASTPAATGTAPKSSGSAAAKPLQKVSVVMPYLLTGEDGGFVVARDKGYYRQAGLDVTIQPGKSSSVAAELVSQGRTTFAYTDAGAAASIISKGGPIKVLAGIAQQSPAGVIYNPGVPVRSPKDLVGKTILVNSSGGPVLQMLLAVLHRAGLKRSDVHIDLIAPNATASTFKAHPTDLVSTFENGSYSATLRLDPKARFVPYAKFGVNILSLSIVGRNADIAQHPQMVRRFVAASLKGWQWAAAHPKQTIDMMLKDYPHGKRFVWQKSLGFTLQLEHTPATKGKPLGWMAASDWQSSLKLLHEYSGMKTIKPLGDYYTNAFLPKS